MQESEFLGDLKCNVWRNLNFLLSADFSLFWAAELIQGRIVLSQFIRNQNLNLIIKPINFG